MDPEAAIAGHYGRNRVEEIILRALKQAGKDLTKLTAADLTPVDQFHVGGLQATEEFAAEAAFQPGQHLLDVGCGIGGAARHFAGLGCRVTGIDLTPEFVTAAESLSRLVRLDGLLQFRQASAMQLPFDASTFDGAYMIHVGMNLADKAAVFREVHRALRPGGTFAIFDILRGAGGEMRYPAPWAAAGETSFVEDAGAYRAALESAGFQMLRERNRRQFAIEQTELVMARTAGSGPPVLGLHLLMGERTPAMLGNVMAMMREGAIEPTELIARAA
jgi:ubiquinone/menaquinone biosynthesis C-methylase UbiE